jgi:hypothetical protein
VKIGPVIARGTTTTAGPQFSRFQPANAGNAGLINSLISRFIS